MYQGVWGDSHPHLEPSGCDDDILRMFKSSCVCRLLCLWDYVPFWFIRPWIQHRSPTCVVTSRLKHESRSRGTPGQKCKRRFSQSLRLMMSQHVSAKVVPADYHQAAPQIVLFTCLCGGERHSDILGLSCGRAALAARSRTWRSLTGVCWHSTTIQPSATSTEAHSLRRRPPVGQRWHHFLLEGAEICEIRGSETCRKPSNLLSWNALEPLEIIA